MSDDIQEIRTLIEGLRAQQISHDELGTANGFHKAEEAKNEVCDFVEKLLDRIESHKQLITADVLEKGTNHLDESLANAMSWADAIDQLAAEGVHQADFPLKRLGFVINFENLADRLPGQLQDLVMNLRLAALENSQPYDDLVAYSRAEAEEQLKKVREASKETAKVLGLLQDKAAEKGVEEASTGFSVLSQAHKERERGWFWTLVVAGILTAIAVGGAIVTQVDTTSAETLIGSVFKRLLLISTPAIAMRLALSKYNLERNLHIVYDHREVVLDQYRTFEAAIGEDAEAKNQFRLAIAKFIFSDPVTGYIGLDSGAELNINPVIGTIEKAALSS